MGNATSSAISRGYTYDANGNRLTTTGPTSTENVDTLTNQLDSITGTPARAYTYDSAGNTLTFTGETFTFNQRGRMSTAVSSAGTIMIRRQGAISNPIDSGSLGKLLDLQLCE